jgi:pimeloyl-ACP methyl ester carboxylesterase
MASGTATVTTGVRDIFVEANGIRHHLIARGSPGSPVVLMIHGLAGQAHIFDGAATRLASQHHVYCLDLRGRGESNWGTPDGYHVQNYVADVLAVLDALGLDRVAIVGTALGGIVAMNFAAAHPQRTTRIVVNDVGPAVQEKGLERILQHVSGAPEMFSDMKAVLKYYRELYVRSVEHVDENQLAEFARHNVRRNDNGVYVWKMDPSIRRTAVATGPAGAWDLFARITCPILVVRGESSDLLSAETTEQMVKTGTDCRVVVAAGAGHAPMLTESSVLPQLEAFLLAGG